MYLFRDMFNTLGNRMSKSKVQMSNEVQSFNIKVWHCGFEIPLNFEF